MIRLPVNSRVMECNQKLLPFYLELNEAFITECVHNWLKCADMAVERKSAKYLQGRVENLNLDKTLRKYLLEDIIEYYDNLSRNSHTTRMNQNDDEPLKLVLSVDEINGMPSGSFIFPSGQAFLKNPVVVCKDGDNIKIFALGSVTS